MRSQFKFRLTRQAVLLLCAGLAASAQAADFEFGEGWAGSWTSSLSLGTAIRARDADSRLYGQIDGATVGKTNGTGNNTIDEGNLNYNKGDAFSTQLKLISEVAVHKGDLGAMLRAKAWYDYTLNNQNVRFGSQNNGYSSRDPLSDKGFEPLSKFQGIYLLDAYVYDTFELAGQPLQVRLGNQVVNWGESLFIQGINQVSPIDLPSFRKPGVQLKEVFLPVPLIFANQSLGSHGSLEAFYQLQWKPTPIEGACGNYWAAAAASISASQNSCSTAVTIAPGTSNAQGYAAGAYVPTIDGKEGRDAGQYGLAYRFNSEALDTEFGLYAQRLNSRTPNLSSHFGTFPGTVSPFAVSWDYANDIKMYGISAATNLAGISVGAELSTQRGVPAQVDGNDLLYASLAGIGPYASAAATARAGNGLLLGYGRTNKTQFQLNGVKAGSNLLGAGQYVLIAEAGFQWNDLPNYKKDPTAVRYGTRAFIFGPGSSASYGGSTCGTLNISSAGCKNDGYVTPFSWGLRAKFDLTYNNVLDTGVTVVPSIFLSQDVYGYSVDSQFLQGRRAIGLGSRFEYAKKYTLDLNYVTYNHHATYDAYRDRDYFAATLGVSF
ncbi:DUF1302 domain-containing protein [Aquabacterium sp.]|uniref:DUF1302 domain-containing protein n=1 Tax=Aquabacterium sp. TaxID=1872578 RepID=UPI0025B8A0EF|nr:DUF1302 domain-containing protein [Aquabacterium sp.]